MSETLTALSNALAGIAEAAAPGLVSLYPGARVQRTALLWQSGVLVTSEQGMPGEDAVPVILPGGAQATATVAGRDPGTNVAVLRVELAGPARGRVRRTPPRRARPGPRRRRRCARRSGMGAVHRVGPAWHSMANGRIDRLIHLDLALSAARRGRPGARRRRRAARHVDPGAAPPGPGDPDGARSSGSSRLLLAGGRVAQGWLGLGLQPVGIPAGLQPAAGRDAGLMVVSLASGGPAEQAGVLPGDILLEVAGEAAPHPRAVARALAGEQVGKVVPLRLLRAGAPLELQATVALRPAA